MNKIVFVDQTFVWLSNLLLLSAFRFFISYILITSSLPKLRASGAFAGAVQAYHLLPQRWVRPFAVTLPWLELALGLLLLVGWQTRIAALISAALFLVFLAAMGLNLARGRKDLDCGCSGKKHAQRIGWKTLARNSILILLCAPLAGWGGGFLALDNQSLAVKGFVVLEQVILEALLPLSLSGAGLWLLARLLRQTVRLVMLTQTDAQPSAVAETIQKVYPVQAEV